MDMSLPAPMDNNMMQGDPNGFMSPMDGQIPPNDMGNNNSEFDTNFDAGVDADENTDPKKYIQQLTGKLSQSLRKYNNSLPSSDVELNKYVAGMILKQSTEGLSNDDKNDIIDKINGDEGNDENVNNEGGENMPPMDDANNGGNPMMESKRHNEIINELFQELTRKKDNQYQTASRPLKDISFKKKPFTAPK